MKMFLNALRGVVISLRNERNLRIHVLLAIIAIVFGITLHLNMGIILLIIGSVLSSEMLNTSIESMCDLIHPDESEDVRDIKDIAAGAVLINVIISVLVGVYLVLWSKR